MCISPVALAEPPRDRVVDAKISNAIDVSGRCSHGFSCAMALKMAVVRGKDDFQYMGQDLNQAIYTLAKAKDGLSGDPHCNKMVTENGRNQICFLSFALELKRVETLT